MKSISVLLSIVPMLGLAGCDQVQTSSPVLKGLAASVEAGQSFDRLTMAIQRDDDATVEKAGRQLRQAAKVGHNPQLENFFVWALTQKAEELTAQAGETPGEGKYDLLLQSDRKYRLAVDYFQPAQAKKSLDPITLNALGYFLASRGQSREDFEKAVMYTKAAYDTWPVPLGIPTSNGQRLALAVLKAERAMSAQDSYAWALYRLGRFTEARIQEEEALSTIRLSNDSALTPDIPFHMAEIYRALGDRKKATREYQAALAMSPSPELLTLINFGMNSLEFREV